MVATALKEATMFVHGKLVNVITNHCPMERSTWAATLYGSSSWCMGSLRVCHVARHITFFSFVYMHTAPHFADTVL